MKELENKYYITIKRAPDSIAFHNNGVKRLLFCRKDIEHYLVNNSILIYQNYGGLDLVFLERELKKIL